MSSTGRSYGTSPLDTPQPERTMHHTNKVGHLPRSYASSPPQTGRAVHGFSKRVQEAELEGDARAGWRKSWPAGADDWVKEVVAGLRIRAEFVENPLIGEVVRAGHREERIRAGRHGRRVYNGVLLDRHLEGCVGSGTRGNAGEEGRPATQPAIITLLQRGLPSRVHRVAAWGQPRSC